MEACDRGIISGCFTAQCKFTAKADKSLQLSDLKDEISKVQRLASRGLADNYFLFTNARLTGVSEEKIRKAFEDIPGIKHFAAYGCDRISQIIRESPRLRMLVPRVYGLGDLSQILDERAYAQAQEILSALGDDLAKFVITDAYQKSAKALVEHGFVLLLGENLWALHRFLAYRCSKEFLAQYILRHSEFIPSLRVGSYLSAVSDVDAILRFHAFGLLPEEKRFYVVARIRELAVDIPDAGFLQDRIRALLTQDELADILEHVYVKLLPNLNDQIDDWESNYDSDEDPADYFDELVSALKRYRNVFEGRPDAADHIDSALANIDQIIDELRAELPQEPDSDDYFRRGSSGGGYDETRSVFDDVDL